MSERAKTDRAPSAHSDPRFRRKPLNGCSACRCDFASVSAFDRHRIGVHAYTYSEGLRFDPLREDGRRCMDEAEMLAAGMEVDQRGRWRIAADAARVREAFSAVRMTTESPGEGSDEDQAA